MSRYVILTSDEAMHRHYLAGPALVSELDEIDAELRKINKYDSWPCDADPERTVDNLVDWVRAQIGYAKLRAGVGES